MNRPAVLAAVFLAAVMLLVVLPALIDPGPSGTYQLDAAPTSKDRLPDGFGDLVAAVHDRTPPTAPPTTTTTRPAPKPRTAPKVMGEGVPAAGFVNGYPCGGDLPPCRVLACESGGNPTAQNPRSTASGLWQILDGAWAGYAGYSRAFHAPPSVQNDKARLLWAGGRGAFHWSSCL